MHRFAYFVGLLMLWAVTFTFAIKLTVLVGQQLDWIVGPIISILGGSKKLPADTPPETYNDLLAAETYENERSL